MMDKVKINIDAEEWEELEQSKRERILELLREYGYDTKALDILEEEIREQTIEDIYNQFYGDEE